MLPIMLSSYPAASHSNRPSMCWCSQTGEAGKTTIHAKNRDAIRGHHYGHPLPRGVHGRWPPTPSFSMPLLPSAYARMGWLIKIPQNTCRLDGLTPMTLPVSFQRKGTTVLHWLHPLNAVGWLNLTLLWFCTAQQGGMLNGIVRIMNVNTKYELIFFIKVSVSAFQNLYDCFHFWSSCYYHSQLECR